MFCILKAPSCFLFNKHRIIKHSWLLTVLNGLSLLPRLINLALFTGSACLWRMGTTWSNAEGIWQFSCTAYNSFETQHILIYHHPFAPVITFLSSSLCSFSRPCREGALCKTFLRALGARADLPLEPPGGSGPGSQGVGRTGVQGASGCRRVGVQELGCLFQHRRHWELGCCSRYAAMH